MTFTVNNNTYYKTSTSVTIKTNKFGDYNNLLRIIFITICISVAIIITLKSAQMSPIIHVNIFGPEKGYWTFITSHYVCTMNSATPSSYSLSPFFLQLRSNSKFVSCCPSFNSSSGTCTNIWTQVISYFSNILSNLLKFFGITFIYIYYLISIFFKLKFYTSHLRF